MPPTFMTCSLLFYLAIGSEYFSADFSYFSHFPTLRASSVVQLICYKFSWIIGHFPDILPIPCHILFPAIVGKGYWTFHHLCSAWFSWWSLLPFISHLPAPQKAQRFSKKQYQWINYKYFFKSPQNCFESLVHKVNKKILIMRNKKINWRGFNWPQLAAGRKQAIEVHIGKQIWLSKNVILLFIGSVLAAVSSKLHEEMWKLYCLHLLIFSKITHYF